MLRCATSIVLLRTLVLCQIPICCLSLILNSYFDIDCFDCLIDYIYFVKNFVNFFDLKIFRGSDFCKVIVV